MRTNAVNCVIGHLRRAALRQDGAGLTDSELLELYVARREEAAFEALLRRHGPPRPKPFPSAGPTRRRTPALLTMPTSCRRSRWTPTAISAWASHGLPFGLCDDARCEPPQEHDAAPVVAATQ
jgi:hypothetical protein